LENKFRNKNYRKLKNIVDSETNFRKYLSQIFEKKMLEIVEINLEKIGNLL